MALKRFLQWLDCKSEKITLIHLILFNCLFATISIFNQHGGILSPETEIRLPYYMSDKPILNKLFDSKTLDMDMYQARELSYFFDFIDSKYIQFSIENGFPHFLSITHYLFIIATGCLLWLFCVKQLNLRPLIGVGWVTLFWTSPSVFLGGVFFRTAKIGVALLSVILFFVVFKIIAASREKGDIQIPNKLFFAYFIAIFLLPFFDEQGLFLNLITLFILSLWTLVFRYKNIVTMLLLGVAAFLVHEIYRYMIGPQLTFWLNGYWPNFSYQEFSIQSLFQNLASYMATGLFLYIETFRFLIGNPPAIMGISLLLALIIFPLFYLHCCKGLSAHFTNFFSMALVEFLIISVIMLIIMNAIMAFRHPPLTWPDVRLTYYWLPANVIIVMTLAILTGIVYHSHVPRWILALAICSAIIGNIMALPGHKTTLNQGYLQPYYQYSPILLSELERLETKNRIQNSIVVWDPVYQFFNTKNN